MRRRAGLAAALLAVAVVAGGCGDETLIGAPGCDEDAGILVAQSVPGAALIPCWDELPGGWTVGEVDIGDTGTRLELDSDRAGESAATFSYTAGCDVEGLGRVPTDRDDLEVHQSIRSLAGGLDADRYFVFDGGCVSLTLSFQDFGDLAHADALVGSLDFVERSALNAFLETRSDDFVVP